MIHLMLKHITYKNSLSKVITKSFHPNDYYYNYYNYYNYHNKYNV